MSVNRFDRWIGRDRLSPDEIDSNRFLKAASLFAGTAIEYGRDRYSGKNMPLFADCLHTNHLKAPRSMTSYRTGTEPKPTVWSFFQNQQNLMRLLGLFKPVHRGWLSMSTPREKPLNICSAITGIQRAVFCIGADTAMWT